MGQDTVNPVVPPPLPPAPPRKKSHVLGNIGMFVASVFLIPAAAEMAPWAMPLDACCGGFLVSIVIVVLDIALVRHAWYLRRLFLKRCIVLLLAASLSLGAALVLGIPGSRAAFQEVFAMSAPPGIRDLSGQRQYAGMFDADDILLRFVADEPCVKMIVAKGGFVLNHVEERDYTGDQTAWDKFSKEALREPESKYGKWATEPMKRPVLYRLPSASTQPSLSEHWFDRARLLWEPSTGRVVVHRIGGSF